MALLFCYDTPDVLAIEAQALDSGPGARLLSQHSFYPGGGGQLSDRGAMGGTGGDGAIAGLTEDAERIRIGLGGV